MRKSLKLKRAFKWLAVAAVTPIVLFFLFAIVIYLPPVQQMVKEEVTARLSRDMGMDISVERVRLAFPLDLSLEHFKAVEGTDTLAAAGALRLEVKVLPLLRGCISIAGFELWRMQVDTKSHLSDIRLSGKIGMVGLEVPAVADLKNKLVDVNKIELSKSDIQVILSDTAKKDTSESEPVKWRIRLNSAGITNTRFYVQMPGDSMRIGGMLAEAVVRKGDFDIGNNSYKARLVRIKDSELSYDVPQASRGKGLDLNHISVAGLQLRLDTLSYRNSRLTVEIPRLAFREQSGLLVENLQARLALDTTCVYLPLFRLRTPYTRLDATADLTWNALKPKKGGRMGVDVRGHVGRSDILLLSGNAAPQLSPYMPGQDLKIEARADGNADLLNVECINIEMKGCAGLHAKGSVRNITSDKLRSGRLEYRMRTYDVGHYHRLLSKGRQSRFAIPKNIKLAGKITFDGSNYGTNSTLNVGKGILAVKGEVGLANENFRMQMQARHFPIEAFLPKDSIAPLTAMLRAAGHGFNPLRKGARFKMEANIEKLGYKQIPLDSLRLNAQLKAGHADVQIAAANRMLTATTDITADIQKDMVKVAVKGAMQDLNVAYLTKGKDTIHLMANLDVTSILTPDGKDVGFMGELNNINILTSKMGYPAKDIRFGFRAAVDTTKAFVEAGDLVARLYSDKPMSRITEALSKVSDELAKQLKAAHFDEKSLTPYLPDLNLYVKTGNENPVLNYLRFRGFVADSLLLQLSTDQSAGINGMMKLSGFRTGALLLEKTDMRLVQDSTGLKLRGNIENTNRRNPNRFTAQLDGVVKTNGLSLRTLFKDEHGVKGLDVGVEATLNAAGDVSFHMFPEESIIAYRKFKVNKGNHLTIGRDKHISADVDLMADDNTGLKIMTPEGDSTRDVTLSLANVNLKELTGVLPFMPRLGGLLSGDVHAQWKEDTLSAVAQVDLKAFRYEDCPLGNLNTEIIYLPDENGNHYVQANIGSEGKDVLDIEGSYKAEGDGWLDATASLTEFPMQLVNGFLASDGTVALDGSMSGEINAAGPVSKLVLEGELMPDSVQILSPLYSVNLRVENKPISIKNSKLHFDNMSLYSISENPLVVNGNIDFTQFDAIRMDLGLKAENFEIINSQQTRQTVVYGNVFTDIDATLKGTTNLLVLRGNLKVLDKTNMTYVMKDSPLTVEDRLSGLVEFVDFTDTTHVKKNEIVPISGVFVAMNVEVGDAVKLHVALSEDGSSYFNCRGGGNLTMRYFPSGEMTLTGRFTMSEGEMKYALPFIPLKTFNLDGGNNYIAFTGNPANPTLNITAIEKTRASVSDEGTSTRMVNFNVGVRITQTLDNMGLGFLIEAPEDMNVQSDLSSMSKEEKEKVAVSLLATGMYLTSSNKATFKANNALNAFLQSEIQHLVGNALKTIDISVGMEGSTSASGNAQTDYSFQFAKHFWNDRVTFRIGGKVTAGSEMASENQSFIDNVSLEYRLGNGTSRNIRLFYDHNNVDPLEGTYSTAGAGLVLRKKTNTFGEIFLFRNPRRNEKNAKKSNLR